MTLNVKSRDLFTSLLASQRRLKFLVVCLLGMACGCQNNEKTIQMPENKALDYIKPIPGKSELLNPEWIKKGEILIAYSDCYDCHKEDNRAKGPAFRDVAKRYPASQIYVEHLARQVIRGSRGSWGYPVMSPHPQVRKEDAEAMVTFILSLRGQ